MPGEVHADVDGAVATVVFDHHERRNALTVDMWQAVPEVVAGVRADGAVRVVVVRGAGDVAFAAGADISEFSTTRASAEQNRRYDALVARATGALAALSCPVIAAVHGFCLGGGLALALAADLRIAADDATFAVPAARLGVGYNAPGVATLVALIGPSATKSLLFTGARIDAAQAHHVGLVDEVVDKASLDDHVAAMAATIAANAPLTLTAVKVAVADLARPETEHDPDGVRRAIEACFDSDDFAEGVRAFLDKRPPRFVGR